MDEKLKSENLQKKSSFQCLHYVLRAIRAGRCRERRYADHIFIQIYFRMHQITRLQRIQNSLARAVVKAPKFSHTTPILRSLHWLKITERIEYKLLSLPTKLSPPPNRHICTTSSHFSLLAALALHLWSHLLAHPHHLLYK